MQFLFDLLCVWLMFLLVSYWVWSDAPITEVTGVHDVPPSSPLSPLFSKAWQLWLLLLQSSSLFHYRPVEPKLSSQKLFKTMFARRKSSPLVIQNPYSSLFWRHFDFVAPHSRTLTWSIRTSSQITRMSEDVQPWMVCSEGGLMGGELQKYVAVIELSSLDSSVAVGGNLELIICCLELFTL